jgi:hypothetical protein
VKKIRSLFFIILVVLMLTACSAGSPAASTAGVSASSGASSTSSGATNVSLVSGSAASGGTNTQAAAVASSLKTHEDAGDYTVDLTLATPITFNGTTISASGTGVQVNGSTATITTPGDYLLSGQLTDGQVVVNTSAKGNVRLILNGVTLTSTTGAPIDVVEADKVILFLADGTQNTVTDAATYVYPSPDVTEPNAAIFSMADLSIAGSGALTVNGNYQDGIASKDGLIIASGNITVTSVDDGIRGKDYLLVEGGSLTITAGGDGLKSDNEVDAGMGDIVVSAGTVKVSAGGDAIDAQNNASITGGSFDLTSGGGANQQVADTASTKGIKAGSRVVIDNGTFTINAADDTLHSNGSITINNGTFSLASAGDGVHADQALTINGGDIQITQSYEGLESAVITLNGGAVHLVSSDDGVNGASGTSSSAAMGGGGMGGGANIDASTYTGPNRLYINGGTLVVTAGGDGIDVNGAIEMTGGLVLVNGPTQQGNGGIDYDNGFNLSGGLLVAVDSSGMSETAGSFSTQNAVLVYLTSIQAGGTPVTVVDSAGNLVLTFTPTTNYQSVAFSSPKLVTGQSYTVYTGGTSTGAASDGLVQDGSYTPGTQAASFTISSVVTTVGTGGSMGGHGPRQ